MTRTALRHDGRSRVTQALPCAAHRVVSAGAAPCARSAGRATFARRRVNFALGVRVPPMEVDDLALVTRARSGDHGAFRALVVRYQRKVYAVALGIVKDPDLAWDVSQEAFVRVHQHLGDFKGEASFS